MALLGQAERHSPQPVHREESRVGVATPPKVGRKRMAAGPQGSLQLRQTTPCWVRQVEAMAALSAQGVSACGSRAPLAQALRQSPQKVQWALLAAEKAATGKPPSPRCSKAVGQASIQASQRLQAAVKCSSGKAHGGRRGCSCGARRAEKKRRRDKSTGAPVAAAGGIARVVSWWVIATFPRFICG